MFEQKYEKISGFFLSENFQFFGSEILNIFEKACFHLGGGGGWGGRGGVCVCVCGGGGGVTSYIWHNTDVRAE